jgi:hypothetical protein
LDEDSRSVQVNLGWHVHDTIFKGNLIHQDEKMKLMVWRTKNVS